MLKTVITGLVVYGLIFAINSGSASAETLDIPINNTTTSAAVRLTAVIEETQQKEEEPVDLSAENNLPEVVTHQVAENETLSDIAKKHNTTWKRLFDKNLEIISPDVVNVGQVITIPFEDEVIASRELPVATQPVSLRNVISSNEQTTTQSAVSTSAPSTVTAASAGNRYVYGYCTWHVKNLRPDLPNNLGNANTWVSRAAAQGFATGSTPRAGAVAMARTGYMHVAYVTSVNTDGTINLSEMNFKGFGVVSTRTAPASAFSYIY